MTKKQGIVDPWRPLEPLRPKAKEPPLEGKRDLHEIDFDADLVVPGRYVIRSTHACFDVTSMRIASPGDALDVLVDCVLDLFMVRVVATSLHIAGIGARHGSRMYNAPGDPAEASALDNGRSVLWFLQKPLDNGMLVLARILRAPEAAAITKKHGVVPMLSA